MNRTAGFYPVGREFESLRDDLKVLELHIICKGVNMKYIAKFVNGYHVSFNTETYENTQVFYLRKDAVEAVKKMNQIKLQRAANG